MSDIILSYKHTFFIHINIYKSFNKKFHVSGKVQKTLFVKNNKHGPCIVSIIKRVFHLGIMKYTYKIIQVSCKNSHERRKSSTDARSLKSLLF